MKTGTIAQGILPLAFAVAVSAWLSVAMRPLIVEALTSSVSPGSRDAIEAAVDGALRFRVVGALLVPAGHVVVTAVLAFLILAAFFELREFRVLAACAAWAMPILTLKAIVRYTVLALGLQPLNGVEDLAPGVGLGFLATAKPSLAYDALDLVNVFDAGYLFVLALLMRRFAEVPLSHAMIAAVVPWAALNAIRIGFNVFFS